MSASLVIPHSPTGEQPHFSDQLHTLLDQLDEPALVSLAILIANRLPPAQRSPWEVGQVLSIAGAAARKEPAALVEALAEFELMLLVVRATRREGSVDHV